MNRTNEYREKYVHALDSIFHLLKCGRVVEADLELEVESLKDHLDSIKSICKRGLINEAINRPGLAEVLKIQDICDAALSGGDDAHIK